VYESATSGRPSFPAPSGRWQTKAGLFLASFLSFFVAPTVFAASNSGTFTGDGNLNKAIAHGLGAAPEFVVIYNYSGGSNAECIITEAANTVARRIAVGVTTVTALDSTNFYLPSGNCNVNGASYAWYAFIEESGGSLPANANGYLKNDGSGTLSWDNASTVKTFLSLGNVENTALSTWAGTTNLTTLGTVSTGTWSGSTIAVNKGGTGQTSYTDGQLLIGNTTGNTLAKATLTAGTNITVTNGGASITLDAAGGGGSLPADAAGWLENDGAGTLSWSDPGTGGITQTNYDTMFEAVAVILYFACFGVFLAVALYSPKKK